MGVIDFSAWIGTRPTQSGVATRRISMRLAEFRGLKVHGYHQTPLRGDGRDGRDGPAGVAERQLMAAMDFSPWIFGFPTQGVVATHDPTTPYEGERVAAEPGRGIWSRRSPEFRA